MEQYQRLNAIILRSRDYKEADQLLTIYTREQGKMTVQVRGVKKTNSKLPGVSLKHPAVRLSKKA